jgi:hypothetical protein
MVDQLKISVSLEEQGCPNSFAKKDSAYFIS